MGDAQLQNPGSAFGLTPDIETPSVFDQALAAVSTITKGDLVALSSSAGYVIRALTGTSPALIVGVALETCLTTGRVIKFATKGRVVTVNKCTGALTAGNIVTIDATTTGGVNVNAASTAVTQIKDVRSVLGVVIADATAAATTVQVWLY
jgi:hypothetical protein